ncbi:hypothetical protein ES705_41332 [subsurface metagenome]
MMENKEPVFYPAITDYICQQGIDKALAIYSKDEVEHHMGGQMFGAKVVEGSHVIEVCHFTNTSGAHWEQVEPILKLYEKVKTMTFVGTILTDNDMILQIKVPWFRLVSGILNLADTVEAEANRVGATISLGIGATWAAKAKGKFDYLKTLPMSEELISTPPLLPDSELISLGITTNEVTKYGEDLGQTGFTVKDLLYGEIMLALVLWELRKIGIEEHPDLSSIPKPWRLQNVIEEHPELFKT